MQSEVTVKIKPKFIKEIKSGYPLILKDAIQNLNDVREEGTIIKVVDEKNHFVGKGYYGKQNKGYGWILTRKESEQINQSFFESKIKSALHKRKQFYKSSDTTAFRVVNGEGDGLGGLIIDYYDGYYVVSWYSEGIYTFRDEIIAALQKVANFKGIYEKKRFDTKGKYIEGDDFVAGERGEFPLIVKENGVNFAVYLNDGAMVGVFLDQRNVRKQIRDKYAKGRTVLNMFSYTGAFSVFAALGGASKTTSVDLANRSLSKTIEQFSVNEVDYEAQDIIVEDVFLYFKYAAKKKWNLIWSYLILQASLDQKYTFSAAKDYKNLLKETIAITENNGIIVASTNCSAFDMKKFKGFIDTAFKEMNGKYKILEEHSLPEDFRTIDQFKEGDYLKVVFIEKIKG